MNVTIIQFIVLAIGACFRPISELVRVHEYNFLYYLLGFIYQLLIKVCDPFGHLFFAISCISDAVR